MKIGDEVLVLSKNKIDENNIYNFAKNADSTIYESYTKINGNVRRKLI